MSSVRLRAALIAFALVSVSAKSQELPLSPAVSSSSVATPTSAPSPLSLASTSPGPGASYVTLTPQQKSKTREEVTYAPFSKFAYGPKTGTLGAGAEVATPIARSANLRLGVNYMRFDLPFQIDGIHYDTGASFRSGQLTFDWFPRHRAFHISPGILYFENGLYGSASVPPGKTFTLDNVNYTNSVDAPVGGAATFVYHRHVAPMVLFGFGNLIPRDHSRVNIPFEVGFAYTGAPTLNVNLLGLACTVKGCFNAATDPGTQQDLKGELKDVDSKVGLAVVYPIITLGISYRF